MVTGHAAEEEIRIVSLTERQLWLIRAALEEYLAIFGHHQGEMVHEIKALLQLLSTKGPREVSSDV